MTQEDFIKEFAEIVDVPAESIQVQQSLEEFSYWDSLSMLRVLSLYDEMELDIDVEDVEKCTTVAQILALADLHCD